MQSKLTEFYNTGTGLFAAATLREEVNKLWAVADTEEVGLFGFAENYVSMLPPECSKVCMAAQKLRAHNSVIVDDTRLPIRDAELDKLFVIHALEHSKELDVLIPELWRILKPSGEIIIIIPNYKGLWQNHFSGHSLNRAEIRLALLYNKFSLIKNHRALFAPPFLPLKFFDKFGRIFLRPFCGVFIFEAEKLIYHPRGRAIKILPTIWELITKPRTVEA